MTAIAPVITCSEPEQPLNYQAGNEIAFLFPEKSRELNPQQLYGHPDFLNHVIAVILRTPKNLAAHVQRIYFCFQQDLPEQLYGALTDLFIVLDRRSLAFSSRLLDAVSSRLSAEHYNLLRRYLLKKDFPAIYLPQNTHTVLGKGLIGGFRLVSKIEASAKSTQEHDPLVLALDCIEYSQLQEAKEILEKAIIEDPDRGELHSHLLELYQSMKDADGFRKLFKQLSDIGNPFQDIWEEAEAMFDQKIAH